MLNQYRRRYLARLQTLLKKFYELADKESNTRTQSFWVKGNERPPWFLMSIFCWALELEAHMLRVRSTQTNIEDEE
jgi:hypothetical protein